MPKGDSQTEKAKQRVGTKFGGLLLLEHLGSNSRRISIYKAKCDCGEIIEANWVKVQKTSHCGCLTHEKQKQINVKHGLSRRSGRTKISFIWSRMKRRCSDVNSRDYKWYGGKGISVCDRWKESLTNFVEDMGDSYFDGASIDRIDPNGNYEPSNCRWLSVSENARIAAISMWASMSSEERSERISSAHKKRQKKSGGA